LGGAAAGPDALARLERRSIMRSSLLYALLLVCAALVVLAPVQSQEVGIKWHQPPDMDRGHDWQSWSYGDDARYQVADDFCCRDGRPVTDVHWWGSYMPGPDGQVWKFVIQFWTDVPAGPDGYSRPGKLIYQTVVENVPENFYGVTAGGETVFEYHAFLTDPFPQERGKIYWLSIIAVLPSGSNQVWGWHASRVHFNDAAVMRVTGADWFPLYNEYQRPVDMAFYLTTEGPGNGIKWRQCPDMKTGQDFWSQHGYLSGEVADDFPCENGEPIDGLVWWGSYPGPYGSEYRTSTFVIRFYEDVPAGVDRPYSHPGTLLYEELVYNVSESYVFTTPDGEEVFEYYSRLPRSFDQERGKIYWLSIVAVLDLPGIWGWHEASQGWNDAAVIRSGPEWYPIMEPTGRQVDMSVVLLMSGTDTKWYLPPATDHAGDWISQFGPERPWHSEAADDFICEDGKPISDVHWWGSYWLNLRGPLKGFWIRFYEDVPWNPETGYSHPGKLIQEYYTREFHETFYGVDGLGNGVYQYYAILPDWFRQEMGKVYWISIVADSDLPPLWGWHDSRFRWNDDAVGREEHFGHPMWQELYNEFLDVSTDMAFELTSPLTTWPPSGYFSPFWVFFSIPLIPLGSDDVSAVLGFDATNAVTRWNPYTKNLELYPDDFLNIEVGRGYMLYTQVDRAPYYTGVIPPKIVYLPRQGLTWIGLPGVEDYFQGWTMVENLTTGQIRSAPDDHTSASPWVNWNFVYWNTYANTWQICIYNGSGDDTWMHPWYGYRVWSWVDNLRLIFNRPCP
jgi:hypothetical protein